MGSPSIGARMMLTGTLRGSNLIAWRYNFCRARPLMVLPEGAVAPWVGRPSVSRKILSGLGVEGYYLEITVNR